MTVPPPRLAPPWEALAHPRLFWWGTAGILVLVICSQQDWSLDDLLGFTLICASALLPSYLWCRRWAHGIPIFPIFTLGTIWTFALPLISHHPLVAQYEPFERLTAAATVSLVNLVGTGCWFLWARQITPAPPSYLGFHPWAADALFFGALFIGLAFNVVTTLFDFDLDPSVFSLLRAVILAWSNLGIFVLGYRAGQRALRPGLIRGYSLLIIALILSTLSNAMMVNGLSDGALALIGYALGRGRLPWLPLGVLVGAALFLQAGKTAVREKYWHEDGTGISLTDYPAFLADWVSFSSRQLFSNELALSTNPDELGPQSFLERASLMHLFLQIQRMTPGEVPYLGGQTYSVIPRLLIPRLFYAEKARAHLGTYMLAIHYHLQNAEDTYTTTIGFGLINEAEANFGSLGCAGLGIVLGTFYGWAGRWSSSYPLLSHRALFTILILSVAMENEFTAGVYITMLFQGSCALWILSFLAMRRVAAEPSWSLSSPWPLLSPRSWAHASTSASELGRVRG